MYTLIPNSTSIARSDGATIPADLLNSDYAAYLAWVAAGNTPTPASGSLTPLAAAQQAQLSAISAAGAASIVAGFTSNALGTQHAYPAKQIDQMNLASSVLDALLALQAAAPWAANTQYTPGFLIAVSGQIFTCMATGKSAANAPTWPSTVGTITLDGATQWEIWTTPFWCEDGSGNWAWVNHTAPQIQQVGRDGKAAILAAMAKNAALAAQVLAATTVAAVTAINWS